MAAEDFLHQRVSDLDRTVGDLREEFGGFRSSLANLATVAARIEGKLDAFQETNREAQRAQDDRINKIYAKFGRQDAVQEVIVDRKGRWHGFLQPISGGIAGGVVSLIAILLHR